MSAKNVARGCVGWPLIIVGWFLIVVMGYSAFNHFLEYGFTLPAGESDLAVVMRGNVIGSYVLTVIGIVFALVGKLIAGND